MENRLEQAIHPALKRFGVFRPLPGIQLTEYRKGCAEADAMNLAAGRIA